MLQSIVDHQSDDAAVTVGHYPYSGDPAAGWVRAEGLSLRDNDDGSTSLIGTVDLLDEGQYLYDSELYKNWSVWIAQEPDGVWRLLHLALLGAEPAAIPGLEEIAASKTTAPKKWFTFQRLQEIETMDFAKRIAELETEAVQKDLKFSAMEQKAKDLEAKNKELSDKVQKHRKKAFSAGVDALRSVMLGKAPVKSVDEMCTRMKDLAEKDLDLAFSMMTEYKDFWGSMPKMVENAPEIENKPASSPDVKEDKKLEKKAYKKTGI